MNFLKQKFYLIKIAYFLRYAIELAWSLILLMGNYLILLISQKRMFKKVHGRTEWLHLFSNF
jgi:hypothetical protein